MSEPVDGDERAATLRAAMVAARERKTSPAARVALLIVTGVAFVFVIGWDLNLVQVVLFLAVFLLHEAGHALGMFIFGYKNVSLFFVPLLGALNRSQNVHIGHPEPSHLWRGGSRAHAVAVSLCCQSARSYPRSWSILAMS